MNTDQNKKEENNVVGSENENKNPKEIFDTPPPLQSNDLEKDNNKISEEDESKKDLNLINANKKQPDEIIDKSKKVLSIPVVINEGQQKIIFLSGNQSFVIHKGAQIPLSSLPTWVKQHPEFHIYKRDKMLVYGNMVAQK